MLKIDLKCQSIGIISLNCNIFASFKQAYVRYQRAQWEMYNEVSFEHDQDKMVSMERVTFFWNLIRLGLVMSCIVGLPTWLLLWRGLYWVHLLPFLVSLAILSATLMMATCFTRISPLFRTFGKEVQYLWLPLFSTIGVFVSILLYVLHISGRVPIFNLAAITSPVMISFTIHAIVCFFMLFSDKKDFVQTLSTGMSSVVPLCVTLFCAIMSVEQYIPNSRIVFAFVPLIFCYICIIILCLYAVCNYELTNRLNFVVIMLMIMVTCLIGTHLLFSLDVTTYVSWIFFVIPYVIFYVIIIQSTFVTE